MVSAEFQEEVSGLIKKIISKMLREDKIFIVFGLELLNYKICLTDVLPKNSYLAKAPAFVIPDLDTIFLNVHSDFFKKGENEKGTHNTKDLINKLTFALLHEISHVMWYHQARLKHRDRFLWNIAGDYMINLLLRNLEWELQNSSSGRNDSDKLVSMNVENYSKGLAFDEKYTNMIEEEIYRDLEKNGSYKKRTYNIPLKKFLQSQGDQNGGSGKGDSDDDGDGPQVEITEVDYKINGKSFKHTDIKVPQMKMSKQEREEKEDRVDSNRTMMVDKLTKGDLSSKMREFLHKLFDVKIDWAKILKDSIATALETKTTMTYNSPRMVYLANAYHLPYLPNFEVEETFGTVIFAIDESGSMGNDDVRKAVSIIKQSKEHYKQIFIIKHDSDVGWTMLTEEMNDDIVRTLLQRRHSGGTSHKGVFERVLKFMKENQNERVSCFIGCTDLYSDIEETQDIIPFSIPRIWIVNNDQISAEKIQGRIIHI